MMTWRSSLFVLPLVGAMCAMTSQTPNAQTAPAPEDVAAGLRIYRQKADCQACHGWAADGRKMDSQMPDGATLRATKLDRDKLIMRSSAASPVRPCLRSIDSRTAMADATG